MECARWHGCQVGQVAFATWRFEFCHLSTWRPLPPLHSGHPLVLMDPLDMVRMDPLDVSCLHRSNHVCFSNLSYVNIASTPRFPSTSQTSQMGLRGGAILYTKKKARLVSYDLRNKEYHDISVHRALNLAQSNQCCQTEVSSTHIKQKLVRR